MQAVLPEFRNQDRLRWMMKAINDARTEYKRMVVKGDQKGADAYWDRFMREVGNDYEGLAKTLGIPKYLKKPSASDVKGFESGQEADNPLNEMLQRGPGSGTRNAGAVVPRRGRRNRRHR
jgi:hypothetical protein